MTKKERKDFFKLFLITALPVAFQNLLQNSLTLVDTLMISRLGETAIAAVGLCGQVFFLVSVFLFGIASGSGIFFSQFWGADEKKGIQKALGLAVICGEIIAVVFSLASVLTPRFVMHLFVSDDTVVELGCNYLRWVGISYMFTAVNMILNAFLRSIGDSKTPMLITFASMICDVVLNYLLIFVVGWGVAGAAIATAISRLLETALLLLVVYKKSPVKPKPSEMFKIEKDFVRSFFKTTIPVIVDDGFWALGMTVYKIVHSHMGVDILACANVIGTIQDLFFVISNGLGAATAVLIGNEIGRGNTELAHEKAKLCMLSGFAGGIIMAVLMVGTSSVLPGLFNLSDYVYELAVMSMRWISILMPIKAMNHIIIVGVLRSGDDTRFVFYLETASIWLIGVPLTYLSGLVWQFPIYIVYLFTGIEEVIKYGVCLPRFLSKKWIHTLHYVKN